MKNHETLTGEIIKINGSDTRYGRRAEAVIQRIDQSTGEVFEYDVLAWKDQAIELEDVGLGEDVGVTGHWNKKTGDRAPVFNVKAVSEIRIIDPATVDVSAYL